MSLILDGTNGLSDVDGTAATPAIRGTDTNTGIFFPAADTIAFSEGGTEVARFDSAGNLGVGTSSPNQKLRIENNANSSTWVNTANSSNGNGAGSGILFATDQGDAGAVFQNSSGNSGGGGANSLRIRNLLNAPISFETNNAERMRIDASGNLLVGTTSQVQSGKFCVSAPLSSFNTITLQNTTTQGAGQKFMAFMNSSAAFAGSIDHTGTTTVAYTTSSDYRMKENVQPMIGALNAVSKLKPCTYTWKEDGSAGQGFIAHELQEVVPDCVTGEKDAVDAEGKPVYQGIDTSFLVATLTAAIQELKATVDAQAARIAALENPPVES